MVATETGSIFFVDDTGVLVESVRLGVKLNAVLFADATTLLTISEDLLISQYNIIDTNLVLDREVGPFLLWFAHCVPG